MKRDGVREREEEETTRSRVEDWRRRPTTSLTGILKKEQWAGPRRHVHTAMQGVVQQLLEGRGLSFPCYTNFFLPSSSLLLLRLQHEHVFFYI